MFRPAALLAVFALTSALLGGGSALPPLQVAEAGTPTRCLAVARLLSASEEESVRMGRVLLILGESNNATAEDTARIQTTVREAEQRRDQAQAVMRRFASAPAPNRETTTHLSDAVSIGALRQELAACASAPASTPTPASTVRFSREDGFDRPGNDLRMVEVAPRAYSACQAACQVDSRCLAFTVYTPPPGDKGFCWLKHAAGERRQGPHVSSGLRVP